MNTFYLKLEGNIIKDVIEYEYEGYTQVELEIKYLPIGINAGYYRWDGINYIMDQELYEKLNINE